MASVRQAETHERHLDAPRPAGPIPGPSAWYGADMATRSDWMLTLDADDVAELEEALAAMLAAGTALEALDRDSFALPRLGPRIEAMRAELLGGRGFALVRGMPVEDRPLREAAALYLGFGAWLGRPVSQNARGHLLGHIIDIGRDENDPAARIYQTSARQYYHADSCDIVALLCLRRAMRGGASTIVSSVTVHNEMLRRAPELIGELFQPFHVDRRGEVPEGAEPWYEVPVFNWHAGLLSSYYVRRYIVSVRRFTGVPPLSARQLAAFDALDAICDDPAVHLSMDFQPGDMQFLHNHQILHDRTGFEDWPQPERRRHLLRLWLCPPQGRELPPAYAARWGSIEPGRRGGILVKDTAPYVPLEVE